jgi:hypothetical protein
VTATTTPQRTYRYLRIAIAAMPVVILVSVAVAIPVVGVLPSISHYFYTTARTPFVGALIAAAVCLFALSGRGIERLLLDIAALFAPLIAIVPTVISRGSVPGVDVTCPGACVPPPFDSDLDNGVITYLIIGALVLVLGVVFIAAGQAERRPAVITVAAGAVVLAATALTWWLWHAAFVQYAHYVAAIAFFLLIAAVALIDAFTPTDAPGWVRVGYAIIAIGMALGMVATVAFRDQRFADSHPVFVGEVVALILFTLYWALKSAEKWSETDPSLI